MASTRPTDDKSVFRKLRAAKNQALFREVNERIEPMNKAFTVIDAHNDFICECANETCAERVAMTVNEYEAVRSQPNRFVVAPGQDHVWPDVEDIVEKANRYWVVEKFGAAGTAAAKLDPRA